MSVFPIHSAAGPAARLSLTRRQLAELDAFLSSEATPSGLLTVEALHGFLTAIALLPTDVAAERWMRVVWHDDPPAAPVNVVRPRLATRLKSHIRRMYDDIVAVVSDPDLPYVPLIAAGVGERPALPGEEWCRGFLKGMAFLNTHWHAFLDSPAGRRLLLPIFLLGAVSIPGKWRHLVSSTEKRAGLIACIPAIVEAMVSELLILELTIAIRGREPSPNAGSQTDSQLCGCGSGLGYSVCCGASHRLH